MANVAIVIKITSLNMRFPQWGAKQEIQIQIKTEQGCKEIILLCRVSLIKGPSPGSEFKEEQVNIGYMANDGNGGSDYCWFTVTLKGNIFFR
jgi:hypothetical protein